MSWLKQNISETAGSKKKGSMPIKSNATVLTVFTLIDFARSPCLNVQGESLKF